MSVKTITSQRPQDGEPDSLEVQADAPSSSRRNIKNENLTRGPRTPKSSTLNHQNDKLSKNSSSPYTRGPRTPKSSTLNHQNDKLSKNSSSSYIGERRIRACVKSTSIDSSDTSMNASSISSSPYGPVQQQLDDMKTEKKSGSETEQEVLDSLPLPRRRKTESDNNAKPEKNNEKNTDSKNSQNTKFVYNLSAVLFIAFLLLFMVWYFLPDNQLTDKHSYNEKEIFLKRIREVKTMFHNQDEMFWLQVEKNGAKHLERVFSGNKKNLEPFSMFVAAYKGSDLTLKCFLKRLGKAFTDMTYKTINASDELSKRQLDDHIKSGLRGDQKYILVSHFEQLSYDKASLFMSYADEFMGSDVAAYPQCAITMSARVPFEYVGDRKMEEMRVEKHFVEGVWENTQENHGALWSRVGSVLLLLKAEDENVMQNCVDDP